MTQRPVTILCLSCYLKGQDFLRECKQMGCRVLLITVEKLRDGDWPRDSIDEVFYLPDLFTRDDIIHGVSWIGRTESVDRIVPLDEFDLEMASTLREHLRVPGMGETTVRFFRDKLAMRLEARDRGIPVPDFVSVINNDRVREFLERVPAPWVLKPRLSASAIGIHKLSDASEVWSVLDELGVQRSFHLLERFVRGNVYHVDSIAWSRDIVFAEAHGYLDPPFEVTHGGGLFSTHTLERDSAEVRELVALNRAVIATMGMVRGVLHTEFIHGADDGRFYFLETAARVGGAFIVEMVEAATGINLWREWARLEVANARDEEYAVHPTRRDYAGLLISLARQEWPDTSAYSDPEIVWRLNKRHHAGLVVVSPDARRVRALLESYMGRFREDFYTSLPAPKTALE